MMTLQWKKCAVLLGMAAVLAGCATHRVVEGDVRSFSRLPAAATAQLPMTYRLERLPSQQTPSFDPILALAEQALARGGLQRNDETGQWVVQLGAQAGFTPRRDPFDDHPPWAFGGWGWYGGRGGWGMSGLWQVGAPAPLHRRVVSIVMRDARTQEVVYETSAVHEDVWVSDPAVYGVLFDAALTGFPQPPKARARCASPYRPSPDIAWTPPASSPSATEKPRGTWTAASRAIWTFR